jgi:methylated-DNA-[protein]-cysteine S-methyltransferase
MSFNTRVWELCKRIPKGKVSTYKELAEALGTKAYRAVGNALNKNPYAPVVPCHRVINSDGGIGGFARGKDAKITLLNKEGVEVVDDKVDLKKFLFRF